MNIKDSFTGWIHEVQDQICEELEMLDGVAKFREDLWSRKDGGGGRTRVIEKGGIFEKGGVNISTVHGTLPESIQKRFNVNERRFFASGISIVLHPESPMIPTVHANFRYFELYDTETGNLVDAWFGGGVDITPYYLFEEDILFFHGVWKSVCDRFHPELYPKFKTNCDSYFFNEHRGEARGAGGIFYDYLREEKEFSLIFWHDLTRACGNAFTKSYLPLAKKRISEPWGEKERYFQELRRGRYVEFNLVHDRGTLFGLKTGGRTESILMSLPPRARWDYMAEPPAGSREAALLQVLKNPRDWV